MSFTQSIINFPFLFTLIFTLCQGQKIYFNPILIYSAHILVSSPTFEA